MGRDGTNAPSSNFDDVPFHTVYLDTYYIDKYEVTNGRYKACVDADVCIQPAYTKSYIRPDYYGNLTYFYRIRSIIIWDCTPRKNM